MQGMLLMIVPLAMPGGHAGCPPGVPIHGPLYGVGRVLIEPAGGCCTAVACCCPGEVRAAMGERFTGAGVVFCFVSWACAFNALAISSEPVTKHIRRFMVDLFQLCSHFRGHLQDITEAGDDSRQ